MSSEEKKIIKKDKKLYSSPQNKMIRSYEKLQSEFLFYIENNNKPKSFRNENLKKLSPKYYEIFQHKFIEKSNHNSNFSPTLDLKNLSTKINSQFKKPLKNTKNNLEKNYNSNINLSKNQNHNINTSKKLPKKALEGIKILQHLIKFNLKFLKNKKKNTKEKSNKKEKNNINIKYINLKKDEKDEKDNKKINEKEQIYKKIKIQKKEENINNRNYRSLSKERDKRKAIQSIISEDNTISLNNLNLKLNSLLKNYSSLKSLNNSLDLKTKLSKSVSDFDLSNCDKLINKIRCQKKLYEILYNIEKKV